MRLIRTPGGQGSARPYMCTFANTRPTVRCCFACCWRRGIGWPARPPHWPAVGFLFQGWVFAGVGLLAAPAALCGPLVRSRCCSPVGHRVPGHSPGKRAGGVITNAMLAEPGYIIPRCLHGRCGDTNAMLARTLRAAGSPDRLRCISEHWIRTTTEGCPASVKQGHLEPWPLRRDLPGRGFPGWECAGVFQCSLMQG